MTATDKCLFHLTIAAKEAGLSNIECPREGVRRIIGPDHGRFVALELCERHYQIVEEWLRREEPRK
jgi:hypothetical protein